MDSEKETSKTIKSPTTKSNQITLYSVLPGLQLLSIVSPFVLLLRKNSITGYFRLNGVLTFGIGGSLGIANATLRPIPRVEQTHERVRLNDFSIIGGSLGSLIISTFFAHRGILKVLSLIPGGASFGIATGFLTGIINTKSDKSN
ncbi:uncharacterized protein MELLADRAFT_101445 [Melampsora larici-populina 98AG31]|uniref:Uncharacterized protein n=1 Tax=Melampsora larici-populina (strain 98AG31 / pathotype 3-4-7) TaxID=747676 RepID=F4R4S0_MELLP|nr:uncharacterized protein MELLADRAFT_101445 [Melampsora larici-populina 98AG31]EGG12951.1 hypothetical protein MELLADRAFT_101445 [Melampsora larici-populina 98AG31]